MAKLIIDTKKSIYKPIIVEIDGENYSVKSVNRAMLKKMAELEETITGGNPEAAYDQLELLFGAVKAFDKLDLREVNEIINHVTAKLYKPEKDEKSPEKNESSPGDKK